MFFLKNGSFVLEYFFGVGNFNIDYLKTNTSVLIIRFVLVLNLTFSFKKN